MEVFSLRVKSYFPILWLLSLKSKNIMYTTNDIFLILNTFY